jgi:hypothetical protein
VVPKHRRSEFEPSLASLASVGASAGAADYWPEAVGYGQAAPAYPALDPRVGPGGDAYYYPGSDGNGGTAAEPAWDADPGVQPWEEWANLGPPPALHPDHPSAPVPRIQLPADHPSAPMSAVRESGPLELAHRRPGESGRTAPPGGPGAGHGDGGRRLRLVPNDAPPQDYPPPGPRVPENLGDRFPRQQAARVAAPGRPDAARYRREAGPAGPGPGPAPAPRRFQDGNPNGPDALWAAGQVLTLADERAAQIAREAQDYAVAMRQGAEREAQDYAAAIRQGAQREATAIAQQAAIRADEIAQQAALRADEITQQASSQAAAIREAAEREAAELRARFESMSGELGRVAAYLTESLAVPVMPATAPVSLAPRPALPERRPARPETPAHPDGRPARPDARPEASPARPDVRPARPDVRPARPDARPARPDARPARPDARPARPDFTPARPAAKPRPAGPSTAPAKKAEQRPRQLRAMRIATYATASLLAFAVATGATEIGLHGFKFFTFREAGVGQTSGNETDQQFLAHEAAATHHAAAPKGRHHKKATLEVHHS